MKINTFYGRLLSEKYEWADDVAARMASTWSQRRKGVAGGLTTLNWDQIRTGWSKTILRGRTGRSWWEDAASIISARGCQSSVRDPSRTPLRCLRVFTSPAGFRKRGGEGGRRPPAFQQLGPRGRVPTCSVKPSPPQCTHVCLCLKRSYFWYPLQGESLDNLHLTTLWWKRDKELSDSYKHWNSSHGMRKLLKLTLLVKKIFLYRRLDM